MKSSVAAVSLLAAVAQAYQPPRAFTFFPRSNTTTTAVAADDSITTLTVIATEVETITSCAPVVTNCPADQTDIDALPEESKSTVVVSHTVILTEVVCPVSDAPGISSSVVEKASTGGITGITITVAPTSTAAGVPAETSSPAKDKPKGDKPEKDTPEEPERTTTTTATTTGTTTVTIQPVVTQVESSPETPDKGSDKGNGSPGNGSPGNGSDDEVCECAPTVTVTAPASTVYVTVDPNATKTEAPKEEVTGVVQEPEEEEEEENEEDDVDDTCEPEDEEEDEEEEEEEEEVDGDDECVPDITTTIRATVTVAPYPTNGTASNGYPAPTGFARLRRN